jgi:hypothetical protein
MTITPGYYRTRGGRKARVLCTDAEGPYPIVGYICYEGGPATCLWDWDSVSGSTRGPLDLVHPWVDAPVVDWSKEREWVKAVAMDKDGRWVRYNVTPKADGSGNWWFPDCEFQRIHPSEYPQFTGDWKDSLCVRPEGGAS